MSHSRPNYNLKLNVFVVIVIVSIIFNNLNNILIQQRNWPQPIEVILIKNLQQKPATNFTKWPIFMKRNNRKITQNKFGAFFITSRLTSLQNSLFGPPVVDKIFPFIFVRFILPAGFTWILQVDQLFKCLIFFP